MGHRGANGPRHASNLVAGVRASARVGLLAVTTRLHDLGGRLMTAAHNPAERRLLLVYLAAGVCCCACGGQSEEGSIERGTSDAVDSADPGREGDGANAFETGVDTENPSDPSNAALGATTESATTDTSSPGTAATNGASTSGAESPDVASAGTPSAAESDVQGGVASKPPLACDLPSTPCGGDVFGVWHVMGCPLQLTDQINILGFGLGCSSAEITSGTLEVSGTWTFDADGNFWDNTTTVGAQQFEISADCLSVAIQPNSCDRLRTPFVNALGYSSVECVDDPEEPGACLCSGTFDQQGGLATISSAPQTNGSYSTSGTTLTTSDNGYEASYEYCVMGDALVLTQPEPTGVGQVVGSIVLQKE